MSKTINISQFTLGGDKKKPKAEKKPRKKNISSKIKQKYTIPTDWQYFINISINKNNLLPKI